MTGWLESCSERRFNVATNKKGGARASKFLKTVNRTSRTSQQPSQTLEVAGEQEETTLAADPAESTDNATAEPGRAQEQVEGRVARSSGRGRRNRAKKRGRPEKPVRITVDLDAERHQFLRDYAFREDTKGTAVIRALLDELQEDPELSERVGERLLDQGMA
jgi:hypothetical protein